MSGRPLCTFAIIALVAPALGVHLKPCNADEHVGKSSAPSDVLQKRGKPHEWQISFVHRIKNTKETPLRQVEVAIALPRSDERQLIRSIRLTPEPYRISTDGWEQETARFVIDRVPPGSEREVRVEVTASLRDVEWLITDRDIGAPSEIPERVIRHYLRNGENYRLDKAIVQRAANEIVPSSTSLLETLRRIHDRVIDSIEYRRDDRWDPADSVLRQGTGSCSEYSYLLIALCRLNGIPARYAGGTWFESGTDGTTIPPGADEKERIDRVFHRWVEVYLPRVGWFPVDATRDDAAEKEGEPYRYFGRLPWSYLTMMHGDGDQLESGLLGWEYRSNVTWIGKPRAAQPEGVVVDRYALWQPRDERAGQLVGN